MPLGVSGYPSPSVNWSFNGRPLEAAGTVLLENKEGASTLSIKNISTKNSGKYAISAENEVGTDTANFVVNVLGK